MAGKNVYSVRYIFDGVRYKKLCSAYDFGVSVPRCLTLYFNSNGGRMVMNADKIEEFEAVCVWRL